ncbi:hypothetical protein CPB84DRAFT_1843481 [Gymnopilus junonius]|uniref:F-box domain-containing protein n=1 Tax=Gymnopilus junonius TaxID=109634 RepID=A0A9P5TR33_GYMJU|nr:hypothetical protein CPB84DRAFT_1843481 [Gymnopilus junonius]
MAVALPYDVWCLIASFIPKAERAKLYRVNSAFFNVFMNQKYREARVYHVGDEDTRRWIRVMSPMIARRVRILSLRPHLFAVPSPASKERQSSFISKLWDHIRQAVRTAVPKELTTSTSLLHNISNMTEVTS